MKFRATCLIHSVHRRDAILSRGCHEVEFHEGDAMKGGLGGLLLWPFSYVLLVESGLLLWPSGVTLCYAFYCGILLWPSGVAFYYGLLKWSSSMAFYYDLLVWPSGMVFWCGLLLWPSGVVSVMVFWCGLLLWPSGWKGSLSRGFSPRKDTLLWWTSGQYASYCYLITDHKGR